MSHYYDDDDLEDYDEDYAGEEEADELSPEDRAQMTEGTAKVKSALGSDATKVTVKAIEEALWHYYYDVDKSVAYLRTKYVTPVAKTPKPTPKKSTDNTLPNAPIHTSQTRIPPKQIQPRYNHQGPHHIQAPTLRHTSLTPVHEAYPVVVPASRVSYADYFFDMPWGNIPKDREAIFSAPRLRGGLLGGSGSAPKMSKLQALAAARKKKLGESKSEDTTQETQEGIKQLSLAEPSLKNTASQEQDGAQAKRRRLEAQSSPAAIEARQVPSLNAATGLEEAPTGGDLMDTKGHEELQRRSPEKVPSSRPSPFAQTLVGSASKNGRSTLVGSFSYPYLASAPSCVEEAFSGPSPDDVVLAAQSKAGKQKSEPPSKKKPSGTDKTVEAATNGVKALVVDDTPLPKSKGLNVIEEYEKSQTKKSVSFVVVGHVDAGKSTLMGRLLLDLKVVNQRTIDKYKREAELMGKSSFALAWVLDQGSSERERGITIDIATNVFETESTSYTILDAPGHRDYIPNMIAGASQADFALLVIDSGTGAFESGLKGQTREHALLIRSMGVARVIVVVNKLDSVEWSQERFDEITQQVTGFMTATGFQMNRVSFVPVSGLNGDNLVNRSTDQAASWYKGPTVLDELESSEPSPRALDKPLRMTISEAFKSVASPLSISGRLESGTVQMGDALLIQPAGEKAYVKAMERDSDLVDWAVAGQNVVMHLSHIDPVHVRVGDIVCDPAKPINSIDTFTMKALAFDFLMPGKVDVHRGRLHSSGLVQSMTALLDKTTGAVIKKRPLTVKPSQVARIVVKLDGKVPLESGQRVVLRTNGETIAAGLLE